MFRSSLWLRSSLRPRYLLSPYSTPGGVCVRCILIRGTFQNSMGRGWRVEVNHTLPRCRSPESLTPQAYTDHRYAVWKRPRVAYNTPLIEPPLRRPLLTVPRPTSCRLCWATETRVRFGVISVHAITRLHTCNHVCPFHLDSVRIVNGRRQVGWTPVHVYERCCTPLVHAISMCDSHSVQPYYIVYKIPRANMEEHT